MMLIIKQYEICDYDLLQIFILCLLCVGDTITKMNAEKRVEDWGDWAGR